MSTTLANYIDTLKKELKSKSNNAQILNFYNKFIQEYLFENSFNNLGVLLKKENELLSLDVEVLFKKIIENKKGGYCFEHNKLVHHLFFSIEESIESKLARVVYNKDIDAGRTHRMNIIIISGKKYIIDLGFGGYTPDTLVPLDGEEVVSPIGRTFRVRKVDDTIFCFEVLKDDKFFVLYTFDNYLYQESDFDISHFYTSHFPKAKFVTDLVMTKFFKDGVKVINGGKFFTLDSSLKQEEVLINDKEIKRIFNDEFKLQINDEEAGLLLKKI